MPHFTMEYSSNLDGTVDFDGLCRAVHETILDTGLFELGAVRVRAFRAELMPLPTCCRRMVSST